MEILKNQDCPHEEIAAYLDGELSGAGLISFEDHLDGCGECAAELRDQRQLLCTLDVAFSQSRSFELPQDFSRVIAAHAESDLSGMRHKSERRLALKVCAVLAAFSFALMGTAWRATLLEPARSFAHAARGLFEVAWRTLYDAGTGLAVIIRVLSRAGVSGHLGLGILMIAFLVSILLLPLLIARYHRAQIIE